MRIKNEKILPFDRFEITNPDYYLITHFGMAVAGEKAERVINRVAGAVILAVVVMLSIHLLIVLIR